jgi:hypothetical protein
MQNLQVYSSCIVSVKETLLLHWGNINIHILDYRQPHRYVSRTVHCNLREGSTLTLCALLFTRFLPQQNIQVQHAILCIRISCMISMYNQYKELKPGDKYICSSCCDKCYTRQWTPLIFCAVCCGLMRQYLQVMYTVYITWMYWQRRILMLVAAPHSGSKFGQQADDLSGPYVTLDHLSGVSNADFPAEILLQSLTTHASAAKCVWYHQIQLFSSVWPLVSPTILHLCPATCQQVSAGHHSCIS